MCRVDLSDVQASSVPEGLKPREKMVAESTPRRSSARRAQLLVAKTRISVPCWGQSGDIEGHLGVKRTVSLAVANSSPSGLSCRALSADE